MTDSDTPGETTPPVDHRWVGWPAVALYLGIGWFPYLASGLMVPRWWAVALMLVWLFGLVITVGLARRRPLLSILMAPGALAFWALYVYLGGRFLGWTA